MIAGLTQRAAASFGRLLMRTDHRRDEVEAHYQTLMHNGFCVVPTCVPVELCQPALEAIGRFKGHHHAVIAGNVDEFGHLYRVVNLHSAIDAVADLFVAETIGLSVCDRFFGSPTALYTSLYYERGSEQDLHRDTPYFCTRPQGKYLGMWLALDDVDDDNGPLRVVPGSHTLVPVDVRAIAREIFPDPSDVPSSSTDAWVRYQGEVQQQCQRLGLAEKTLHMRTGDVVIWHPELLHGGAPHNLRDRSRRSLVMHVTPVGVPVYHMDVFFNPDKPVSSKATWNYVRRARRSIAEFPDVDFGHAFSVPAHELR
jgi:phytanoyl-CoA hydroxylase